MKLTTEYIQQNMWLFVIIALWELFWKGKALWRAAKNNQVYWFIAFLVLNTVGILPILYLTLLSKKEHK